MFRGYPNGVVSHWCYYIPDPVKCQHDNGHDGVVTFYNIELIISYPVNC